jgi:hypothetical protein
MFFKFIKNLKLASLKKTGDFIVEMVNSEVLENYETYEKNFNVIIFSV